MHTIYTDGSCEPNPGPGGWAFVVYEGGAEVYARSGAEDLTTNNRMELQGVLEALLWLNDRPGEILSDSQYAVNGIAAWMRGWKARGWKRKAKGGLVDVSNVDLWQRIDAARRPGHAVRWVRGHTGNAGNEMADRLAEAARRGRWVGQQLSSPPWESHPTGIPQGSSAHGTDLFAGAGQERIRSILARTYLE